MSSSKSSSWLLIALYLNAALLAIIAFLLLGHGSGPALLPAAFAQNQLPIGGGAGVFIVPAQFSDHTFGCYIMDVDAQTIAAYQFYPADKQLRLVAARSYRHDRRLEQFNSGNPTPDEVQQLLELQQQGARVREQKDRQKHSPEPAGRE